MGSKNFDRYGSIKADIAGAVHLAHAARSQRRLDLIRAKLAARGESHQCAELYPASPRAPQFCIKSRAKWKSVWPIIGQKS
jgi:hypothetical protein